MAGVWYWKKVQLNKACLKIFDNASKIRPYIKNSYFLSPRNTESDTCVLFSLYSFYCPKERSPSWTERNPFQNKLRNKYTTCIKFSEINVFLMPCPKVMHMVKENKKSFSCGLKTTTWWTLPIMHIGSCGVVCLE